MPPSDNSSPHACLLSFDVEEHFHIEAARSCPAGFNARHAPSRVVHATGLLLDLLHRHQAEATFFILGCVARRYPALVRRIAAAGHEIACHGYDHDRLHHLNPVSFRNDIGSARALLQDLSGQPVVGYRAPTFSLVRQTAWAVDVLIEQGFEYDSSIQPVRHPQYGVIDAPRDPYLLLTGGGAAILEIPPLTWQVGPLRLPVAGGGYFRLLPLSFMLRGIAQAARRRQPAMLYFHPWEFDPDQPRLPLTGLSRFRTYVGLRHTVRRLEALLARHRFMTAASWIAGQSAAARPRFALAA